MAANRRLVSIIATGIVIFVVTRYFFLCNDFSRSVASPMVSSGPEKGSLKRMVPKMHVNVRDSDGEPIAYNDPSITDNMYSPAAFTTNLTHVNEFYNRNQDLIQNGGRFKDVSGITNSGEWEIQAAKMSNQYMDTMLSNDHGDPVKPFDASEDSLFTTTPTGE